MKLADAIPTPEGKRRQIRALFSTMVLGGLMIIHNAHKGGRS